MKKGLILTVMLVSVLALGYSQTGSWNVTNVATWVEAVGAIRSGGNNKEYVITVNGNISVPSSTENTFGSVTGITITIQGSGTLSPSANGSLLYVGAGQTVIVKDLTLKGRADNNNSVVCVGKGGTLRMEGGATVSGNTVTNRDHAGGGVYVKEGFFIMQDRASVSGNTYNFDGYGDIGGGGIFVDGGTFTMLGNATVTGNTALSKQRYGGGGGGVFVDGGTFTMQDNASVSNNTTSLNGGGVIIKRGTFNMQGGTISGNRGGPGWGGGGVSIGGGTFTMQNGVITGNIADNGGGVDIHGGTFIMQDGTISNNTAGRGGGVDNSENFTMQGGTISNNTATDAGGGVCNYENFAMQGGTISNNTATRGGGVYNSYGTFAIQNNASVSGNTAVYYGGGVFIYRGTLAKSGGTIHGDDAEQNLKNTVISGLGHVVYYVQNGSWRNATARPTMNSDSYGFWLNEGDVTIFPSSFTDSGFTTTWKRSNFNNTLTLTDNMIKSSSSNYLWILQRIAGNAYTFKRSDASNTMTLTIRLDGNSLVISGDSGNGQDNWNGTWRKQ